MVCGFGDSIGYENLVSQLLGKKIDKTSRLTNWSNRPLSKKQINYAISDVTHLFEVYPLIRDKIINNKRESWFKEEIKILISKKTYDLNPHESWKRLKYRNLNKNSIGILVELAKWREIKAQEKDVPRGNIIRDDAIYELCSAQPKNKEDLNNLRSFNRKGSLKKEFAEEILQVINKGISLKKEKLPKFKPLKEYIRTEQIINTNERINAGFLNERNLILLLVANEKMLIFYNFSSFGFLLLI